MKKLGTQSSQVRATYHFYCDSCNKYLGFTHECDDGWFPNLGEFELKFLLVATGMK